MKHLLNHSLFLSCWLCASFVYFLIETQPALLPDRASPSALWRFSCLQAHSHWVQFCWIVDISGDASVSWGALSSAGGLVALSGAISTPSAADSHTEESSSRLWPAGETCLSQAGLCRLLFGVAGLLCLHRYGETMAT